MKNLGVVNFCPDPIEELEKHFEAVRKGEKHEVSVVKVGRCITKYACVECGISWETDTSD